MAAYDERHGAAIILISLGRLSFITYDIRRSVDLLSMRQWAILPIIIPATSGDASRPRHGDSMVGFPSGRLTTGRWYVVMPPSVADPSHSR